CQQHYTYPFTF
nr:immunoglobulin light chain junction region [Macaca mulatta]MOW41798.1 immunoglobulin light chain junction region [Macaca mulatta]